nr:polysaccharide pyruvyl transferase family protein [uncultured Blautia sp.]
MEKVVLVTKIGKNYGALLQAYALKKAIENCGCDVNILRYELTITQQTYEALPKFTGVRSLKRIIKSFYRVKNTRKSIAAFQQFREDYFDFTCPYRNFEELRVNPPEADVYITGSDQVWNPKISFDPAYYLMFGNEKSVRASYAASIGISKIPTEYEAEFLKRVKDIPYRSVREEEGKELLSTYGISSYVNIDPTMLLSREDYNQIAKDCRIDKPYVLLYLLKIPKDVKSYIENLRRLYPDHVFVNIPGSTWSPKFGDMEMSDIGPCEFIGLVRNADAILTTSFHGTVFSIIHNKKFMTILPQNTGGRITSLLKQLNLLDRITSTPSDLHKIKEEMRWDKVEQVIEEQKNKSYKYLKEVVGAGKDD